MIMLSLPARRSIPHLQEYKCLHLSVPQMFFPAYNSPPGHTCTQRHAYQSLPRRAAWKCKEVLGLPLSAYLHWHAGVIFMGEPGEW